MMLKVTKELKDSVLTVTLTGTIEDPVDLYQLMSPLEEELVVNCKGVTRVNSVGVQSWVSCFQKCQTDGIRMKFVECSPPIVELMSFIVNFNCGAGVESVYLPFACGSCYLEFMTLFMVEDLKKSRGKDLLVPCVKCQKVSYFDDIQDEFLAFLDN